MDETVESLHKGRRERRRAAYIEHGLDSFAPHEILELLLYFAIPRGDTNKIAHELINEFETLAGVFDASAEQLKRVNGIGGNAALLIKLIPDICEQYSVSKAARGKEIINTPRKAGEYFRPYFLSKQEENVYVIWLDNALRVIKCDRLIEGGLTGANVDVRKIIEMAILRKASHVLLAHNHPSGNTNPSSEDIELTKRLSTALATINVKLTDHIIIAGDKTVALSELGLIS